MELDALFSKHVARLQAETEAALAESGFDSLVVSSGPPFTFFADDRDAPFEPTPHFAHWCPLTGPHHLSPSTLPTFYHNHALNLKSLTSPSLRRKRTMQQSVRPKRPMRHAHRH